MVLSDSIELADLGGVLLFGKVWGDGVPPVFKATHSRIPVLSSSREACSVCSLEKV